MRKKVSLLFIVLLLAILTIGMVACNKGSQDAGKLPGEINPPDIIDDNDDDGPLTAQLRFAFPKGATSVFYSMFTDEFNISDVEYYVVYLNTQTQAITEGMHGNLSESMLQTDEDKANIKKAGHHQIKVQVELGKDEENNPVYVKGSFALHLQDKLAPVNKVQLNFNLMDGERRATAHFNCSVSNDGIATTSVLEGVEFKTWDEFISTFRMTIEKDGNLPAKALESVSINNKVYSATSKTFPLVINDSLNGKTFTTKWTDDTVKVTFALAVPSDAALEDGKVAPSDNEDFEATQTVRRNFERAVAPATDILNVYNGYYFAGWYLDNGTTKGVWDENDTIWNFAKLVGSSDVTLIARWTKRVYSFTLYTMGGEFESDIQNARVNNVEIKSDEIAKANGLTVISAASTFGIESQKLTRVEFSGFEYGADYSKCVAKIAVTPSKEVYVIITDLKDKLVKGNGEYVKAEGVYGDYQCQNKVNMTRVDGTATKGYVKWVFNSSDNAQENLARLSAYYSEVVFKNGLSVKADGSLRIDKIADESVSELIIPAELVYDGATRKVSEISEEACLNLKALTKLDLTNAVNLTTIGAQAFAYAPHLREITVGETLAIENVGEKVFYGSEFESNYFETHKGKQIIVLGNVLYKYAGQKYNDGNGNVSVRADVAKSLDLSNATYYTTENCPDLSQGEIDALNAQLQGVVTIASGAFANATALESIKLGDGVQRIENGAFANLANFAKVEVNATSNLAYIGESAFSGTSMLETTSGNYNSSSKAIVIGKVYYRFIDKEATSASLPMIIEHIAPYAFNGCSKLSTIVLTTADNIKTVGKRAFTTTQWIRNNDDNPNGFVIVKGNNGTSRMLVEYFADSNGNTPNVDIPDNVTYIGEETFNFYANRIKTVKFGTNIERIENYAFNGAIAIESLIFTRVAFNENGNKLVGAPFVAENAFADENGNLIHDAKFYFTKSVLEGLDKINNGQIETTDETTLAWAQLYRFNKDNFVEEKVDKVYINTDVISTKLLKTDVSKNAFETTYGGGTSYNGVVAKGLVVLNNTGIDIKENLDMVKNDVQVVEVTKDHPKFGKLYEEGVTKYVVTFTYNDGEGCQVNYGDEFLYVATVRNAIKGNPSFYESGEVPTINAKGESDYYLTGFEGQDKDDTSATSLFYTSFEGGEYKFVYTDINGKKHTLDISKIENFDTSKVAETQEATVTVDFYGLGTYKFKFSYRVEESKIKKIVQDGAISVALNTNVSDALDSFNVCLIGQDGSVIARTISANAGFQFANPDTSTLGIKSLEVRYSGDNVLSGMQSVTLVYSVVLEADASLFEYGYVDQKEIKIGETTYAGKASITGCRAQNAETIVLPTTWTDTDGSVYIVTEIASGAFENFKKLKAVYLAANIETIRDRAFANCTALENVYTAQKTDIAFANLTESNFETTIVSQTENEIVYNAVVANLDGIEAVHNMIAIGAQYIVEATKATEENPASPRKVFNVIGVKDGITFAGELFLPDTIQNNPTVTNAEINVYSSKSNVMFKVAKYVNDKLTYIGTNAFSGTEKLKNIDLSKATKLDYIGANAFEKSGLTAIDLSKNTALKEINASTFACCGFLKIVTLPSSVSTIEQQAMYNCSNLSEIIATDIVNVANNAFDGCVSIKETTISAVVATLIAKSTKSNVSLTITSGDIADNAFNNNKYIVSVNINNITRIGEHSFENCTNLAEVYVSDSLREIGSGAFMGTAWYNNHADGIVYIGKIAYKYKGIMPDDTTVVLNDGTLKIHEDAFKDQKGLVGITVPKSVVSIAANAFDGCDNFTTITSNMFEDCTALTEFTIPSSVTKIETSAFKNCSALTSITISSKVTNIESSAFLDCTGLSTVNWNATACTKAGDYDSYIFSGCTNLTTVNIGDNVTTIPSYTFRDCMGLIDIVIGNSVMSIGDYAFDNTAWYNNQPDGLVYAGKVAYKYKGTMPENTSITIKDGTLGIGDAFSGCKGLTSITIPDSVTSIGNRAFNNCTGLTSITIPDSVMSIGSYAFNNCTGLTGITIPDSVTSIGEYAFSGCKGLTSIKISNSVTSIDYNAFSYCSGVMSIVIPDSVTSIGEYAFLNCTGLTSVTIGKGVTSIDRTAFGNHSELASIIVDDGNTKYHTYGNCLIETGTGILVLGCYTSVIPSDGSVKSIGLNAFDGCTRLTSITIPNSVTSIGDYAFFGCTGLTNIVIPNTVMSIGGAAFSDCTGLISVTIGSRVSSIGWGAFSRCSGLETVIIDSAVIATYAYNNSNVFTSQTIYVKEGITIDNASYIAQNFTKEATSDKLGYVKYTKN